jgi:hypothetical protein
MTLEHMFFVSQTIGAVAVVASLLFVGWQIKDNTKALQRHEHNNTMAQWTVVRMAIVNSGEVAELMTAGLHGERALSAAEQLRLEQFLQEQTWACFHIWDRMQRGIFPPGTFELTGGAYLRHTLTTAAGSAWWRSAKNTGFIPAFVADVDALLVAGAQQPGGDAAQQLHTLA